MTAFSAIVLAQSSWSAVLFSNRSLGIALWVGLAVLSLALLILMRTHWGQAQPLSKCIVLSVFAHLLLFMYAYGTRLFVEQPPGRVDEPIQLAFIQTDEKSDQAESTDESQPWTDLTAEDTVAPGLPAADKSETASLNIERTAASEDWAAGGETMPSDQLPDTVPERDTEAAAAPTPIHHDRSPVAAAAMDPLPRKRAVDPDPVISTNPIPDRIQPAPTTRRQLERGAENRLPSQLVDIGSRMQQLADIEPRAETGDSLPGQRDQLSQSENRGDSAIESTGILAERSASESAEFQPLVAIPSSPVIARKKQETSSAAPPATVEQIVASVPRRLGDGRPIPEPYRLRNAAAREEVAAAMGGGTRAAAAVESALAWLAAQQERDGRWDPARWGAGIETHVAGEDRGGAGATADTGITGLAILAFLANGESHLEGIYRKNVQHGLEYLLRSQKPDGNLAGNARFCSQMYCHGMASLALSEALALTGDVRIQPYVENAVKYSVAAQHETTGGWRYQPGDQGDMSQFGWQVMALKSAQLAGIEIPQRTRDGMLHFLVLCQKGNHGGLAGYRPGMPPSRTMTAEALACRYFIEGAPTAAQVTEASEYLLSEAPQSGTANYYYWYYGTLAMFQAQGDAWQQWNDAMQSELTRRQRTDGHLAGSWDPDSVWGSYGGRVYSTAMATLCLEVYYRYLPLTAMPDRQPE
jgi:hypothetical protein